MQTPGVILSVLVCLATITECRILLPCENVKYKVVAPIEYLAGVNHRVSIYTTEKEKLPAKFNLQAKYGNVVCNISDEFRRTNDGLHYATIEHGFPRQLAGKRISITYEVVGENKFKNLFYNSLYKSIRSMPNVLICETDKPIYRPGESIKARVLTFDSLKFFGFKPMKTISCTNMHTLNDTSVMEKLFVELKDPKGRVVQKWALTENSEISYRLFPDAVEGEWHFSYGQSGSEMKTHTFKVEQYLLPRYKVTKQFTSIPTVETESAFTGNVVDDIKLEVCAKYTNGRAMEGQVKGDMCLCGGIDKSRMLIDVNTICGARQKTEKECYPFENNLERGCVSIQYNANEWRSKFGLANSEIFATFEIVEPGMLDGIKETEAVLPHKPNNDFISEVGEIHKNIPFYVSVKRPTKDIKYFLKMISKSNGKKEFKVEIVEDEQEIVFPYPGKMVTLILLEKNEVGKLIEIQKKTVKQTSYADKSLYIWPGKLDNKVICPGRNNFTLVSNFNLAGKTVFISSEFGGKSFHKAINIEQSQSCENRDDVLGHFTCVDGKKKCLDGWRGLNCLQKNTICTDNGKCKGDLEVADLVQPDNQFFIHRFSMDLDETYGPELKASIIYIDDIEEIFGTKLNIRGLDNCISRVNAKSTNLPDAGVKFSQKKVKPGEPVQLDLSYKSQQNTSVPDLCLFNAYDVGMEKFFSKEKDFAFTMQRYIAAWKKYLDFHKYSNSRFRRNSFLKDSYQKNDCKRIFRRKYFTLSSSRRNRIGVPGPKRYRPQLTSLKDFAEKVKTKDAKEEKAMEEPPKLRDYFPESWIFTQMNVTDYDEAREVKQLSLQLTAPDTITKWKCFAYCITQTEGLYIPPSNAELTVEKLFHLDVKLPKETKRGEIVHLPVSLFFESEQLRRLDNHVRVTVKVDQQQFEVVAEHTLETCVTPDDSASSVVMFVLKPKTFGQLNITISAQAETNNAMCGARSGIEETQSFSDVMLKAMRVVPEGKEVEATQSVVACLTKNDEEEFTKSISFLLPKKGLVEDSVRAYVAVTGNLLGSASDNLGDLVKKPYGCGEQNMITVSPSVSVLQYMQKKNVANDTKEYQAISEIKAKAVDFIKQGWSRELNYKLKDGSFSAFGESDKIGSTWLTAFVLNVFADAKQSVPELDVQTVFQQSIDFLKTVLDDNSCVLERGRVLHSEMVTDEEYSMKTKSLSLSIHVMNALQNVAKSAALNSTEYVDKVADMLKSIDSCINKNFFDENLSIEKTGKLIYSKLAYTANQMRDSNTELGQRADSFASVLLNSMSKQDLSDNTYWADEKASKEISIQTTAYAFLALEDALDFDGKMNVIRWLIAQQRKTGGFYSTQDTIMGLKAMSRVILSDVGESGIDFAVKESSLLYDNSIKIPQSEASLYREFLVAQFKKPMKNDLEFKWKVKGTGCVQLTSTVIYNQLQEYVSRSEVKMPFVLDFNYTQSKDTTSASCRLAKVNFCIKWNSEQQLSETGMLLATLTVPTGYVVNEDGLQKLVSSNSVASPMRSDRRASDGAVHLYFNGLSKDRSTEERCASVELMQMMLVEKANGALLTVEDYYNNDWTLNREYSLSSCAESWQSDNLCNCIDLKSKSGRSGLVRLVGKVCREKDDFSAGFVSEGGHVTDLRQPREVGVANELLSSPMKVISCPCADEQMAKDKAGTSFSFGVFKRPSVDAELTMTDYVYNGNPGEAKQLLKDALESNSIKECFLNEFV